MNIIPLSLEANVIHISMLIHNIKIIQKIYINIVNIIININYISIFRSIIIYIFIFYI